MHARIWLTCTAAALAVACGSSDAGITTKVKSQLASDDVVKAYEIDVDTRDRVVTLSGTVDSETEEAKAIALARGTEGVADVVDNITVEPDDLGGAASSAAREAANDASEIGSDAWITTNVKSKLLADDQVGGLRIDVDTEAGVVTLSGTVRSAAEHDRAVMLARQVEGVKNVNDRLTVSKG